MEPIRAIVTGAHKYSSEYVIESLHKNNVEIISCGRHIFPRSKHHRQVSKVYFYPSSKKCPEKFINKLIKIISDNIPESGKYVLIACHDEIYEISKNKERFSHLISILLPPLESLKIAIDKWATYQFLLKNKYITPETYLANHVTKFESNCNVFIKPRISRKAFGVRKLKAKKISSFCKNDFLIQEEVFGQEYCACLFSLNGIAQYVTIYKNLLKYPIYGMGIVRVSSFDGRITEISKRLAKDLNWSGVLQIDIIISRGIPHVIEINPRFWAGLSHSMCSGIDYPWILTSAISNTACDINFTMKRKKIITFIPPLTYFVVLKNLLTKPLKINKYFKQRKWIAICPNFYSMPCAILGRFLND